MAYLNIPTETIGTAATVTGTTVLIDLSALALRLEPGDVVAICVATVTSSATAAVAINWQER